LLFFRAKWKVSSKLPLKGGGLVLKWQPYVHPNTWHPSEENQWSAEQSLARLPLWHLGCFGYFIITLKTLQQLLGPSTTTASGCTEDRTLASGGLAPMTTPDLEGSAQIKTNLSELHDALQLLLLKNERGSTSSVKEQEASDWSSCRTCDWSLCKACGCSLYGACDWWNWKLCCDWYK
jgi:hypothetical protein